MNNLPPKNPSDMVVFGDKWNRYIKWSHFVTHCTGVSVGSHGGEYPGWTVNIQMDDGTRMSSFKFERELDAYAEMKRIVDAMNETLKLAQDRREQVIGILKEAILGSEQEPKTPTDPKNLN